MQGDPYVMVVVLKGGEILYSLTNEHVGMLCRIGQEDSEIRWKGHLPLGALVDRWAKTQFPKPEKDDKVIAVRYGYDPIAKKWSAEPDASWAMAVETPPAKQDPPKPEAPPSEPDSPSRAAEER